MLLMLVGCVLLDEVKGGFEEPTYMVRFEDGFLEEPNRTDWQERAYPVTVQIWKDGEEMSTISLEDLGATAGFEGFGGNYSFIVLAAIGDDLKIVTHECEVPISESNDSCNILDRDGEIGLNCSYTFGSCYGQVWSGSGDIPDTGAP